MGKNGGLGIAGSMEGAASLFAVVLVGGVGYKYGQHKDWIAKDV